MEIKAKYDQFTDCIPSTWLGMYFKNKYSLAYNKLLQIKMLVSEIM